jgi:hypothetical protein
MVVCWVRQPFFLWRHFRLFAASPLRRGGCGLFAAIRGAESLPISVAFFGSIMIFSISWFVRAGINEVNHPTPHPPRRTHSVSASHAHSVIPSLSPRRVSRLGDSAVPLFFN